MKKSLLLLGCGGVGKCFLWLLDRFIKIDPKKITIVDLIDYTDHPDVAAYIDKGAKYIVDDLNKIVAGLIGDLKPYDIVVDCTDNTDSVGLYELCQKSNCHYFNTSIEEPKNYDALVKGGEQEFKTTYQYGHNQVEEINLKYPDSTATSVFEFGANPGSVSHFVKHALMVMAKNLKKKTAAIKTYTKERKYNALAKELGVEAIHISETDSTDFLDKGRKEFCNTWCCNGLLSEYNWPSEFGWGSHEKRLPKGAELVNEFVVDTNRKSKDVYVESYVPDEKFIGCVISHGEGLSLASYLKDGDYAPTVHYAYRFSPIAWRSVKRLGNKDTVAKRHVVNNYDDSIEGTDTLGCLLLLKNKKAFWCGSILDNDPEKTGNFQGTLVQVAVPLLACVSWALKNPDKGSLFPEDVDSDYILKLSLPYLGRFYCDYVDYSPASTQFTKLMRSKKQFDEQF